MRRVLPFGGLVVVLAAVLIGPTMGCSTSTSGALKPGGRPEATAPAFCRAYPPPDAPGQWQSQVVRYSAGKLAYVTDSEQNRVPDYSYAGYRYGSAPLPSVPEVLRLTPEPGDNTARIQRALDEVGARPLDAAGLRGAVVLAPGTYEIRGTLRVKQSGVVLRGSGQGGDPARDTILLAKGDEPHHRTVVVLGSDDNTWPEVGAHSEIVTPFVPVGALSLTVQDASGLAVGDNVVIHHPSTQAWLDAIDGGGTVKEARWKAGSRDILYNRRVAKIEGAAISLDAPIYYELDRKLSQTYVVKTEARHSTQVGLEDLRVDIDSAGAEDEMHAWVGVLFSGAQDSWARRVSVLHYGLAGFQTRGAVRLTFEECASLDPVCRRLGGLMYAFDADARSQLLLLTRCTVREARHGAIVNGGTSASGIVFHRFQAQRGGGNEGGHRNWAQGVLIDSYHEEDPTGQALLINRGDMGTSHGWGCVHSVIWNYNREMYVQQPPTGQNYAVSNSGTLRGHGWFPGALGHVEIKPGELVPESLYEAQLCERLKR